MQCGNQQRERSGPASTNCLLQRQNGRGQRSNTDQVAERRRYRVPWYFGSPPAKRECQPQRNITGCCSKGEGGHERVRTKTEKCHESEQKVKGSETATNFGSDTEIPNPKPASVRKDSSDSTKARRDLLKKEKTKEHQDALPKRTGSPTPRAKGPKGSTRSADQSPNDVKTNDKKGQIRITT